MRSIFLFTSFLVLSSCASISEPYYYNEIVVLNNTRQLIPHVVIRAEKTNNMFGCRNIAPGAKCSNKTKKKEAKNNKLKITWTYNGVERTTGNFKVKTPEHMHKSIPLRAVLALQPDGTVRFWLEQDKPSQ